MASSWPCRSHPIGRSPEPCRRVYPEPAGVSSIIIRQSAFPASYFSLLPSHFAPNASHLPPYAPDPLSLPRATPHLSPLTPYAQLTPHAPSNIDTLPPARYSIGHIERTLEG